MMNRCPATDHAPITMTERGWKEMCLSTRRDQARIDKHKTGVKSFCSTCKGKTLPPNLTIKTVYEMLKKSAGTVAGKIHEQPTKEGKVPQIATRQPCDGCGDKELLTKKYYDRNLCGKCHTMFSNVRNYLPVILKAMSIIYPDQYGEGVSADQVNGTTVVQDGRATYALAKIAKVVDFPDGNAEALATNVEEVVAGLRRRVQESSAELERIKAEYSTVTNQLSELEKSQFVLPQTSAKASVDSKLLDLLLDCPEVLHSREKLIALRESVQ